MERVYFSNFYTFDQKTAKAMLIFMQRYEQLYLGQKKYEKVLYLEINFVQDPQKT